MNMINVEQTVNDALLKRNSLKTALKTDMDHKY